MAALPAALILQRPCLPWRYIAGYGLFTGAGQFGLLYLALSGEISPGLASLVIQAQVFMTIGLAALIAREQVRPIQIAALLLSAVGLALIAALTDNSTTPLGLVLVLLAAFCWACGNLVVKAAGNVPMLPLVVWGSLFSFPPLAILSAAMEGPSSIVASITAAPASAWAALLWQSAANTLFGYAAWNWLLCRHPAALITPMALLVPVFGMSASAILLGEPMPLWKLTAAALVLAGLVLNFSAPIRKAPLPQMAKPLRRCGWAISP